MKITIEINEEDLQEIVNAEVKRFIKRKIDEDIIGDCMSRHWEIIDREIDAYIEGPQFVRMVRETLRDSEDDLIKAVRDRVTGNF